MPTDIDTQVAILQTMTMAQLRERYAEVFGEAPFVTNNKAWFVKRIAWRLQALAEGDLSERARLRAAELAQDAALRVLLPRDSSGQFAPRPTRPARDGLPTADDTPAAGTRLRRLYKGRTLEVKVLTRGFEYEGHVYASLSALAKTITGSHCSGRRFFGLQQRQGERESEREGERKRRRGGES